MSTKLTKAMIQALIDVGYGVRGYADNKFRSEGDPERVVRRSSLGALLSRGLIQWYTTGGAPNITMFELTEEGARVFEEQTGLRY